MKVNRIQHSDWTSPGLSHHREKREDLQENVSESYGRQGVWLEVDYREACPDRPVIYGASARLSLLFKTCVDLCSSASVSSVAIAILQNIITKWKKWQWYIFNHETHNSFVACVLCMLYKTSPLSLIFMITISLPSSPLLMSHNSTSRSSQSVTEEKHCDITHQVDDDWPISLLARTLFPSIFFAFLTFCIWSTRNFCWCKAKKYLWLFSKKQWLRISWLISRIIFYFPYMINLVI